MPFFLYNIYMYYVVLVTVDKKTTAEKITEILLKNKLAACINIIPNIKSLYFWEGKLCGDKEVLMVIKSRRENFGRLSKEIKANHPYKVPEIIALPIIKGNKEYLDWVKKNTSGK